MSNTKLAILNAAEGLFATKGFAATSMRAIAQAAGVNLASASYHFGSKDRLIEAVLQRRLKVINDTRLDRLEQLKQRFGDSIPVEALVEAFVAPLAVIEHDGHGGRMLLIKLLGRAHMESVAASTTQLKALYVPVIEHFGRALAVVLPDLPEDELAWRFQFMFGGLAPLMIDSDILRLIGKTLLAADDPVHVIPRLTVFLAAGLRAPPIKSRL